MKKYVGSLIIAVIGAFLGLFGIVMAVMGSTTFRTEGLKPARSTYNAGVALNIAAKDSMYVTVEYDLDLKKKYISHAGALSLRYML